ncbi:restriction endonuclease subunit S [Bradyrhizobium sp. Bra64]|uniref:restriction endonuclease subunit S n=1 Tax=Bradyrhizobium sp. Bra64 TaxID=2926009 RepID=UPI002118A7DA|nr:restriction endonuclease subunit S [Bradyrhizobium sp. Bra64]
MNAESFLVHYAQIADAPDAIGRLRRFILDLAVRGKLVPQDPNDEPAVELLKRIAEEKARLVKAGKIRTPKASEPIREDELPISVPRSWAWARLCDIGKLSGGMTPSMNRSDFWDGDIVWLSPKDIKSDEVADSELRISAIGLAESGLELYRPGCLFMVARSGILKRTFPVSINRVAAAANQDMKVLAPFLDGQERYLQIMFRGLMDFILRELVKTGTTVQSLKYAEFEQQPFPLPPLAEQQRIVAKVDELMDLCDRLEAARGSREAVRDRLAAASLARFNAPDPETFQADADFALNALPALTTRPDQIKQLRQTILNLAVRGKLVPQEASDEPASELLKRIAKEKTRLVKAGEIKKEKALDSITFENQPFDLPREWAWVRLDALSRLITKGSSPKWQGVNYVNANEGILFITSENVGNYELRKLDDLKYVESRFREVEPRSMLKRGDILMNLVGASIGRTAIYDLDLEANINQAVALVRLVEVSDGPLVRYLLQYFNSPIAIDFMLGSRVTTAQANMSLTDAREFPIPLPPLAEQYRIVAKVDALMALCDRLEASLIAAAAARRRLLDALLAEALAPLTACEMEAAE